MDNWHERTASILSPAKLAQAQQERVSEIERVPHGSIEADAGKVQLDRMVQLCAQLDSLASTRVDEALSESLRALAAALEGVDFNLLQARSWWDRTTGKARNAGAEFAALTQAAQEAAARVTAQVQVFHKSQQPLAAATERAMLELEVEFRALNAIVEQGARWLQDMRAALKARLAQAQDAQAQKVVRDEAASCERLVVRLKFLRVAASEAGRVHAQGIAVTKCRTELVQALSSPLLESMRAWKDRMGPLAAAAGDDKAIALSVEGPIEVHRALSARLKVAIAASLELQAQEQSLAASLAALRPQLAAPGG